MAGAATNTESRRTELRSSAGEVVSIADAAAECGVTVGTIIGWMVQDGMLLEHPNGGYLPVPHADLIELNR